MVTVSAVMVTVFESCTCSSLNHPLLLVTTPAAVTAPPDEGAACVTAMVRVMPPPATVTVPVRALVPEFAVALTVKLPLPEPLVADVLNHD
jgi:hypothetical protein